MCALSWSFSILWPLFSELKLNVIGKSCTVNSIGNDHINLLLSSRFSSVSDLSLFNGSLVLPYTGNGIKCSERRETPHSIDLLVCSSINLPTRLQCRLYYLTKHWPPLAELSPRGNRLCYAATLHLCNLIQVLSAPSFRLIVIIIFIFERSQSNNIWYNGMNYINRSWTAIK